MVYCERCGTRIPEESRYCPRCGTGRGASRSAREIPCRFCQAYNRPDRTFCLGCRKRIIPLTPYDVSEADFVSQADRETLGTLQSTEPLPHLVQGLVGGGRERSMRRWLASQAVRVENGSRLDNLIRNCAEVIGLEILPESFVVQAPEMNAATFGRDERPMLAITSGALQVLDEREATALVGHELGHVKSKHLLYHTLAESLGAGAQMLASLYGAGLVAMPIQMLLLSWHRESEISADRAALLLVGDPGVFSTMMSKITGYSPSRGDGPGDSLAEAFQTHPTFTRRLAMIREYHASPGFSRAREKVETRRRLKSALVPACRFCGATKGYAELYCRACGRSQY